MVRCDAQRTHSHRFVWDEFTPLFSCFSKKLFTRSSLLASDAATVSVRRWKSSFEPSIVDSCCSTLPRGPTHIRLRGGWWSLGVGL